jgi:hypothetical protein
MPENTPPAAPAAPAAPPQNDPAPPPPADDEIIDVEETVEDETVYEGVDPQYARPRN